MEKTDRNETFYESPKEMEKRKKLRREWVIPGFVNYSFQTIPTMISSLSDYALYKGAMFMSKNELKMSLGLLTLKKKFEYRVRRSSKTHFDALYKQIRCKFQLRAVEMPMGHIGLWVSL